MLGLYQTLCEQGVLSQELEHAKCTLINAYPFLHSTPQKRLMWQMQAALYGFHLEDEEAYAQKAHAVSVEKIEDILQKDHHPQHLHITLAGR